MGRIIEQYSKTIPRPLAARRFILYPNPSNIGSDVFLEITNAEKETDILVVINDRLGNQLYSKVIITDINGSTVTAIDQLNRLAPGTYIIVATSKNELYKKKTNY